MTGRKKLTSLAAMAGVAVLTTSAQAFMVDDAKILIDRALNSPTLTIKYSGAAATLVELKINGTSFGTRQVTGKTAGETNFTLDLSQLADGENQVDVFLYGKDGALVGKESTTITSKRGDKGPVFLVNPKVGSTVRGTIDIKVGFGKDLKNSYVSFFVDNQFKSMTNNPPYSYLWDTTRETAGWHEVEAWVVTGDGDTYKTNKTKIFVDNPGGPTRRPVATKPEIPVTPVVDPPISTSTPNGIKISPPQGVEAVTKAAGIVAPIVTGVLLANTVKPATGAAAGLKPAAEADKGIMMDQRNVTPGETKVPAVKATAGPIVKTVPKSVIKIVDHGTGAAANVTSAASTGLVSITKGQRLQLPNMSPLTIMLNSRPINFDVAPRIQDGIPLTPFRHLFEGNGGTVDWDNVQKILNASGEGQSVWLKIGDKMAKVNKIDVELELAPFIERGRTMVPLSFIRDSLSVDVQYDPATGHVLITKAKKN